MSLCYPFARGFGGSVLCPELTELRAFRSCVDYAAVGFTVDLADLDLASAFKTVRRLEGMSEWKRKRQQHITSWCSIGCLKRDQAKGKDVRKRRWFFFIKACVSQSITNASRSARVGAAWRQITASAVHFLFLFKILNFPHLGGCFF